MKENEISKWNILKLVLKINFWMCMCFNVAIFILPFTVTLFIKDTYTCLLLSSGIVISMPAILFVITWIICIIYSFKKNIAKEIKNAYMLMPIYYTFVTLPIFGLESYIISLFM